MLACTKPSLYKGVPGIEKILDLIPDFLNVLLPVVTLWAGWATGRLREKKKKEALAETEAKALKDGVKGLLRAKVIDLGLHYLDRKSIPPYGMETLRSCYDPYMALGDGDPAVTHIMKKCEALQVCPASE